MLMDLTFNGVSIYCHIIIITGMLRIHIYYYSINTMHTNPIEDLHLKCPSSLSMSLLWTRECLSTGCHISMSAVVPKGKTIIVFRKIEYLIAGYMFY